MGGIDLGEVERAEREARDLAKKDDEDEGEQTQFSQPRYCSLSFHKMCACVCGRVCSPVFLSRLLSPAIFPSSSLPPRITQTRRGRFWCGRVLGRWVVGVHNRPRQSFRDLLVFAIAAAAAAAVAGMACSACFHWRGCPTAVQHPPPPLPFSTCVRRFSVAGFLLPPRSRARDSRSFQQVRVRDTMAKGLTRVRLESFPWRVPGTLFMTKQSGAWHALGPNPF